MAPSDIGAILVACLMPAVLAVGNVFRTRYWPIGASPRQLAGLMLVSGGALTLPAAFLVDGVGGAAALVRLPMLIVLAVAIATFVAQYVAFFRLQQLSGPVYMSQIGSVAAIVGGPVAVIVLKEELPQGFVLAALLIVAGLAAFQYSAARQNSV